MLFRDNPDYLALSGYNLKGYWKMNGMFRLNEKKRELNPALGSHDPSMMWDPVTKAYYSYSTDIYEPEWGLNDKIGIPVRCSKDMISFRYLGTVLSEKAVNQGRDNGIYKPTWNFWAPFTEYVHGEYRMYYSATKAFGSSESRIWLAVSDRPEGPFENRGVVMDTWGTDDTWPNAIDPHIVRDENSTWLVYGSFFGGIYIKELDDSTGLPAGGNCRAPGTCISRKADPPRIDGPEGAAVMYCPETEYFYLFQSYGWLGDDYDIRVGRSHRVQGPYMDREGKNLVEESPGFKIANSYCFTAANPDTGNSDPGWKWAGFRGPGHGVPFYDPVRQQYFFVHHIRDGAEIYRKYDKKENRNSYKLHLMMIRRMFFINGWPVLSPEPFGGENDEKCTPGEVRGWWELIFLTDDNNDMKYSRKIFLDAESPYLRNGILHTCQDYENGRKTTAVTGITEDGIAYWGKAVI